MSATISAGPPVSEAQTHPGFRGQAGPLAVLAVLMLAYAILFSWLSIQRHDSFGTAGNDLGNLDQAVWNTSQGRWFESTNWRGGTNRLGAHVEPILLPLSLTYWLASTPKTLLVLQALLLALGAAPLYLLAVRRFANGWIALPFAASYLLFPALQAANLYEFHPLTLTAPFFALAVFGLLERENRWFVLGAVLAVACKEDMPLVTAAMGVYAGLAQRRWRFAAATIGLSAVWFFFAMSYVIPTFNPNGQSPYLPRYRELGDSVPSIILTLVTQPWRAAPLLADANPVAYVSALLLPVAGLAILSPLALLPVLPPLAENLLSSNELQRVAETNHYPAPMAPFLVAAAVLGAARLAAFVAKSRLGVSFELPEKARLRAAQLAVSGILLIGSLSYSYARGMTPLARDFEVKAVTEHHRLAEDIIRRVPREASVSATPQLNPHLTQRRQVVVYPRGLDFDVIALDTWPLNVPMVVEDQYQTVKRLLTQGYGLTAARNGLLLLQKNMPSVASIEDTYRDTYLASPGKPQVPLLAQVADVVEITGYDLAPETPSTPYVVLHLRAGARPNDRIRLWLIPGDRDGTLYPGQEVQLAGPTFYPPTLWPAGGVLPALGPTYGRWRNPGTFSLSLVATSGGSPADLGSRLPIAVRSGETLVTVKDNVLRLAIVEADGRLFRDTTPRRLTAFPADAQRPSVLGSGIQGAGSALGGCDPAAVRPPCTVSTTLYWQSAAPPAKDLTVFLHVVDSAGKLVAQSDGPPDNGVRPSSGWFAGEVVADRRAIELPASLPPGRYKVLAGLYDPVTGARIAEAGRDSIEVGAFAAP